MILKYVNVVMSLLLSFDFKLNFVVLLCIVGVVLENLGGGFYIIIFKWGFGYLIGFWYEYKLFFSFENMIG